MAKAIEAKLSKETYGQKNYNVSAFQDQLLVINILGRNYTAATVIFLYKIV